ncbi:MAG: pyridoxal phosphate-dependent aminotransferase [Alphaproteobacteria bacterium]|nr:pyridoxal phosphate-dependent aminotransferase [Alphaproteobacteria bacterium]MCB9985599.1 pyridoxal phosphate-dependent aminotransferase [Micavibrio sp.]
MDALVKTGQSAISDFNDLLFRRVRPVGLRPTHNLSSGNPSYAGFPPAVMAVQNVLQRGDMRIYATGAGYDREKSELLSFCNELGLRGGSPLTVNHLVMGLGATHLYFTALMVLRERFHREHSGKIPVILMTAPSYGLFTLQPEHHGFEIETVPLRQEDDWVVEPEVVADKIRQIEHDGTRKVFVYYNINPHNPTGTVLNSEVIQPLAAVLEKHHVFAIDDFAYYGLEYEGQSDPIARYNPDRTITLFSCSKAFGMPRLRAGFACGSEDIMHKMNDSTSMQMISLPAAVAPAVTSCYGEGNLEARQDYLANNLRGYHQSFRLMKAMVCGINSISAENHEKSNITHVVREAIGDHKKAVEILKTGMPSLELVNPDMKAGYFAMLRVRNIDQYYYGEKRLTNTFQFAAATIDATSTLTLPMNCSVSSHCPDILRVTFAGMAQRRVARALYNLYETFSHLTSAPDSSKQKALVEKGLELNSRFDI